MIQTYANAKYQREEETILKPLETRFEVNVIIHKADNLFVKNGYMESIFQFFPFSPNDNFILDHQIEKAIKDVKQQKPDWSRKIPTSRCKSRRGLFVCNQLFLPKCNQVFDRPEDAVGAYASLTLHLREDPVGDIYLQCEYCDFVDREDLLDEPENPVDDPLGDYDF
tara:strand:+ start:277 stop:777 length:501 start_codon:yes stop_codon:yes gene_type:complete